MNIGNNEMTIIFVSQFQVHGHNKLIAITQSYIHTYTLFFNL